MDDLRQLLDRRRGHYKAMCSGMRDGGACASHGQRTARSQVSPAAGVSAMRLPADASSAAAVDRGNGCKGGMANVGHSALCSDGDWDEGEGGTTFTLSNGEHLGQLQLVDTIPAASVEECAVDHMQAQRRQRHGEMTADAADAVETEGGSGRARVDGGTAQRERLTRKCIEFAGKVVNKCLRHFTCPGALPEAEYGAVRSAVAEAVSSQLERAVHPLDGDAATQVANVALQEAEASWLLHGPQLEGARKYMQKHISRFSQVLTAL